MAQDLLQCEDITTVQQEPLGEGMSESVRGTANPSYSCTLSASPHHLQDSSGLQRLTVGVDEQPFGRDVGPLRVDVAPEQTAAPIPEEDEPLLAHFAIDLYPPPVEVNVVNPQGGKLCDPDPGVDEEPQYGLVSGGPGCGQQLLQLFFRKGLDDLLWGATHLESAGDVGLQVAFLSSESEEGLQSTGLALDRIWGEAPRF